MRCLPLYQGPAQQSQQPPQLKCPQVDIDLSRRMGGEEAVATSRIA